MQIGLTASEFLFRSTTGVFRALQTALMALLLLPPMALATEVGITAQLPFLEIMHKGQPVQIERNADTFNTIEPDFSLTSRPCPPYCVQPMSLGAGVETLGELELLDYLKRASLDGQILIVDSREPDWIARSGLIPGAVNLPWTDLHPSHADQDKIVETLTFRFGATYQGKLWNFENAKTLILYCNGPWCGQSPTNIRQLLALGYPAQKLKWYRGGMQAWKALGFNTVRPE